MFTNENQTFSTEKLFRFSFLGSLLLLCLTGLTLLFPTSDEPKRVSAATRIAESETNIAVTTGSEDLKLRLLLNDLNGNFAASEESDKTKFNVTTNNFTGYTLTVSSDNDDGDLINYEKDDHFSSIDAPVSITTFNDASYNNQWGFFPSKYNSEVNTEFLPAPTTEATILDVTNAPNETANDYSIGVGVRAGFEKASGTYTTSFILNVTGNPVTYAILYADNTSDSAVSNLPATQSSVIGETNVTLSSQIPTRTNYTFLNWCLGTATQNGTICNGKTYNPGDEFDLDQTSENAPTLYAIWSPNIAIRVNSGTTKVTLNGHVCNYGEPEAATVGCIVTGLKNGESYLLTGTLEEGHNFSDWNPGSGTIADTHSLTTNFAPGATPTTITPNTTAHTYPISLANTDATTPGSTSTIATRGSREVTHIINPKREYTVAGFAIGNNNSNGATVSSTHTIIADYVFKGWYDNNGTRIITSSNYLEPNTPYTDAFGRWSVGNGAALHAVWGENPVTLPTISKEGWTCGWSTLHTTNTIQYASGYSSFVPTDNTVLHGVCVETGYTITFKTVDANNIEFDGTLYNDNQTVKALPGTYSLRGHYAPRYAFSSWNATAGTISNAEYVDYNLNTYTVTGNATITLTGQYVETELQNLESETCTTTPIPAYDNRDNQVYWIKRLDDGNCWMMDNLNLGAVHLSTNLTSANTNLSSSISASTFNNWRKNTGTNSFTSPDYIPVTSEKSSSHTDIDNVSGTLYGTLYNYCAASAGTICTDSRTNDPTSDLCPKGWRMAKGGEYTDPKNEFGILYANPSYNTYAKMRAPVSENGAAFALAGDFGKNWFGNQNSYSQYWTGTTGSYGFTAYHLFINGNSITVGAQNLSVGRTGSGSIRCIRKKTDISTITYLQDMTPKIVAETTIGTKATLKDKRDNEEYLVGKLEDGGIWMLENLRTDPVALSLDTLKGETNAPDEALTYLKHGGGDSYNKYSINAVQYGVPDNHGTGNLNHYNQAYIIATEKNTTGEINYGEGPHKIGILYNHCAATAGAYCPDLPDSAYSHNLGYDICPKGWEMPVASYYGDQGPNDYTRLLNTYKSLDNGSGSSLKSTLNLVLFDVTTLEFQTTTRNVAELWSHTSNGNHFIRVLRADDSSIDIDGNGIRQWGASVRCAAKR